MCRHLLTLDVDGYIECDLLVAGKAKLYCRFFEQAIPEEQKQQRNIEKTD
jgi:hypothetical protein